MKKLKINRLFSKLKMFAIIFDKKYFCNNSMCFFFIIVKVRPNAFRLRMPVWVTDFQFIDERNRCLVATGHHQVSFIYFC